MSPPCCLHMVIIAAQFSVEKSQISYMYIYNINLVPANMAVNGVFRVRGGGTGAWNLYTRTKRECLALSLGVHKQAPLFSRAPMPHIIC